MEKLRACKPSYEKENQQRFVNKKTDLLSSLHNIKLPLQPLSSNSATSKFHSVPIASSLIASIDLSSLSSARDHPKRPAKQPSLTQDYCNAYGNQVESLHSQEEPKGRFLSKHKIDGTLRARMLDWMVEVMCSYSFQHKTYFAGVEIMDRYFAKSQEALVPTQLHIIGVQCMFVATKMEEVYPLKMKTIFDKIAHKKIPIIDLVNMEKKIVETLDFCLTSSTFFDLAMTRICRHLCAIGAYDPELLREMEDVCSCLGKFMTYNYAIGCEFSKEAMANTLCNFVLSIFKIKAQKSSEREMECKEMLIETIGGFRRQFKGLNNLAKFTDKKVLQTIEQALF